MLFLSFPFQWVRELHWLMTMSSNFKKHKNR